MGSKQCGKCGEVVDEAKAFCPGCGNAFVEEERRDTVSDFDMSNETVQLGSSMYNQLLSDMGLSISKAPNKGSKAGDEPDVSAPVIPPAPIAKPNSARTRWLIRATVAAFGLLILLTLVLLVVLFLLWPRIA